MGKNEIKNMASYKNHILKEAESQDLLNLP